MLVARHLAWRNPVNYYLAVGLGLLVVSAFVPLWTGQRAARVEDRAAAVAAALAEAVGEFALPPTADDVPLLMGRFFAVAARDGAFVADLAMVAPLPETLLTLVGKHYVYHVAISPPEVPSTRADLVPGYEVAAWPIDTLGPGHAVFFLPDDAPRAYTRNLAAGYSGLGEARVVPGRSHARQSGGRGTAGSYRSRDDERWLEY
ncbi:MAG: hypothetical protein RL398_1530 [Planctomycetota bacterium]|jgi:hypothetical protein